jgi:protein-tyrosine phosphatase
MGLLEGAKNFRELGGLAVADGRTIRHGVVYRSEALSAITDRDRSALDTLGIRVAYDLRTPQERQAGGLPWSAQAKAEIVIAQAEQAAHGSLVEQVQLAIDGSAEPVRRAMLETYRAMPAAFAPVVGDVIERVAAGRTPLLISCLAGKDRTGFVSAMLLFAAGADYPTVEQDYLRSNLFFGPDRIAQAIVRTFGRSAPEEAVQAVAVRAEYLRASVEAIEAQHRSIDAYLESCAGLTPARRAALEAALLERSDR